MKKLAIQKWTIIAYFAWWFFPGSAVVAIAMSNDMPVVFVGWVLGGFALMLANIAAATGE